MVEMSPQQQLGIDQLAQHFGQQCNLNQAVCHQHGQGEGHHPPQAPNAVLFLKSTEEVAKAVSICHCYRIPIIAYGAGTSLEGHLAATRGGVCINLSAMKNVLELNAADFDIRVEAGITREELNHYLKEYGVFFPVDPGANASIGGMASTRASGTNAVRYGTMKELVLGLTVVTPDGKILHTGGRSRKSAAGYDLSSLYIGSEGTLGVITEIQLRLVPVPEQIRAAVCSFASIEDAITTVIEAMQLAVPLARIELLNGLQMAASIAYSKLHDFSPEPTLFLEFHGSQASVSEQITQLEDIAAENRGRSFRWAENSDERNQLWRARHSAYFAATASFPGCEVITTDVCVPVSNLATAIQRAEAKAEALGLHCALMGHAGDGNFHMLIPFDPDVPEQQAIAKELSNDIVEQALTLQGSCTGEHGIGLGKKNYLIAEHGDNAVAVMASIKRALDPHNIMNPDKILDI